MASPSGPDAGWNEPLAGDHHTVRHRFCEFRPMGQRRAFALATLPPLGSEPPRERASRPGVRRQPARSTAVAPALHPGAQRSHPGRDAPGQQRRRAEGPLRRCEGRRRQRVIQSAPPSAREHDAPHHPTAQRPRYRSPLARETEAPRAANPASSNAHEWARPFRSNSPQPTSLRASGSDPSPPERSGELLDKSYPGV
jgi:hypothetical protein